MFKFKVDSQDGYLLAFLKSKNDLEIFKNNLEKLYPGEQISVEEDVWDKYEIEIDYLYAEYTEIKDESGNIVAFYTGHVEPENLIFEHKY